MRAARLPLGSPGPLGTPLRAAVRGGPALGGRPDAAPAVAVRHAPTREAPARCGGGCVLARSPPQGGRSPRRITPMSASPSPPRITPNPLHAPFLAILPRIKEHGRVYFRHVKCAHRKEELLAELR